MVRWWACAIGIASTAIAAIAAIAAITTITTAPQQGYVGMVCPQPRPVRPCLALAYAWYAGRSASALVYALVYALCLMPGKREGVQ